MPDIETWKLAALAAAAAIAIWPRRAALVALAQRAAGIVSGSAANSPAATDANTVAAAYRLLAEHLTPATAASVRSEIANALLAGPPTKGLGPITAWVELPK